MGEAKYTDMVVQGRRNRGRPKKRWMDSLNEDLRARGLTGEEFQDLSYMETACQKRRQSIEKGIRRSRSVYD